MKRLISLLLITALLSTCFPSSVYASDISTTPDPISPIGSTSDQLFALRAKLLTDPDTVPEDIKKIDQQLLASGVEAISHEEVAEKLGIVDQPMYDVYSTSDTRWFSERFINVWNGQRFEVQIITGQGILEGSPLNRYDMTYRRSYVSFSAAIGKALQVVIEDIITESIEEISPTTSTVLSSGISMNTLINTFIEEMTTDVTVTNLSFSCHINLATTMRYAFVKYEGAVDEGNQILACESNAVSFTALFVQPTYDVTTGDIVKADFETVDYYGEVESYGFDVNDCRLIAAETFWTYKNANANFDVMSIYHQMTTIPLVVFNTTYNISVPWEFPYLA